MRPGHHSGISSGRSPGREAGRTIARLHCCGSARPASVIVRLRAVRAGRARMTCSSPSSGLSGSWPWWIFRRPICNPTAPGSASAVTRNSCWPEPHECSWPKASDFGLAPSSLHARHSARLTMPALPCAEREMAGLRLVQHCTGCLKGWRSLSPCFVVSDADLCGLISL
jgi:hypothetical protein